MLNRERKTKEHKSIIIRTRKDNTVIAYMFTTYSMGFGDRPSACQKYATFNKIADRVEISWNVGGDVFIHLYQKHPDGFEAVEKIVFDKKNVTAIEIETYF